MYSKNKIVYEVIKKNHESKQELVHFVSLIISFLLKLGITTFEVHQ